MLSPEAVAKRLGVCGETICREIRRGNLGAVKVGGQWRVTEEEFARYTAIIDKPLCLYFRIVPEALASP